MINEDWERVNYLDKIYLPEHQLDEEFVRLIMEGERFMREEEEPVKLIVKDEEVIRDGVLPF